MNFMMTKLSLHKGTCFFPKACAPQGLAFQMWGAGEVMAGELRGCAGPACQCFSGFACYGLLFGFSWLASSAGVWAPPCPS